MVITVPHQSEGLPQGGVSVLLTETLGLCGAAFSCPQGYRAVGLEINANHLRGVFSGWATDAARGVHCGRTTPVWQIELRDEAVNMTCISRITMAISAPLS